jgi:hypothetical protein
LTRPPFRFVFAGQTIPGEALADNLAHGNLKAIRIAHAVPVIISKRLLVEVPVQVERFYRNVVIAQPSFIQATKRSPGRWCELRREH